MSAKAAKRFANGFYKLATELGGTAIERLNADVLLIDQTIADSKDLQRFLKSPIHSEDKKNKVLLEIFKSTSPETQVFLKLINRYGRTDILADITKAFSDIYNKNHNIKNGVVTTAVPLTDVQMQVIIAKALESMAPGAQVVLKNHVDPSIIGGFTLTVEDLQIDGSLRSKLQKLRKEFDENQYIPSF